MDFWRFRDELAGDILNGLVEPSISAIAARAQACSGLAPAEAAANTERFLDMVKRDLARRPQAAPRRR